MPFRQVIAGYNHSCGVARLRQGYCWGLNSSGQLGAGDKGEHPSPTQVSNPAE
jgi:alpha-tubulin suppressor-like RCC1 family protein